MKNRKEEEGDDGEGWTKAKQMNGWRDEWRDGWRDGQ